LPGENPLQLPQNVAIDLSTSLAPNTTITPALPSFPGQYGNIPTQTAGASPLNLTLNYIDILFMPSSPASALGGSNSVGATGLSATMTVVQTDPSGIIYTTQLPNAKLLLWVRDVTQDASSSTVGEQTLVTLYCRTGFIAAHPVDTTAATSGTNAYSDPYSFTRDGRSSGM
jgi:hypothetical protein